MIIFENNVANLFSADIANICNIKLFVQVSSLDKNPFAINTFV